MSTAGGSTVERTLFYIDLLTTAKAHRSDLIFADLIVFQLHSPDHKLATYAIGDPVVEGIACHFNVAETVGWSGYIGLTEDRSDASLASRQVGPISFKDKFQPGEEFFPQKPLDFLQESQNCPRL